MFANPSSDAELEAAEMISVKSLIRPQYDDFIRISNAHKLNRLDYRHTNTNQNDKIISGFVEQTYTKSNSARDPVAARRLLASDIPKMHMSQVC